MKIDNLREHAGVAGQFSVSADVTYPDEPTSRIEFVGSVCGGPVIMCLASGTQTLVTNPERFGKFGKEWVQRFFEATTA